MNRDYWDYKNILEFVNDCDFDLYVEYNEDEGRYVLRLEDLQGANLGDIESDEFYTFEEVVDRMSVYIDDYFIRPVEEEFGDEIEDWNTIADLYNELIKLPKERTKSWSWTIDMIGLIGGHYEQMEY